MRIVVSGAVALMRLYGRVRERETLDRQLRLVRGGRSAVLVLRGEAGVGKTALLEHVIGHAGGCRVARTGGVQSEMELPFAGLQQLCAPLLDGLESLPAPQGQALRVAFGLQEGERPIRSSSRWRRSPCWRRSPRSSRWYASSTMRNGSIAPRHGRCPSSLGGCWPSASG